MVSTHLSLFCCKLGFLSQFTFVVLGKLLQGSNLGCVQTIVFLHVWIPILADSLQMNPCHIQWEVGWCCSTPACKLLPWFKDVFLLLQSHDCSAKTTVVKSIFDKWEKLAHRKTCKSIFCRPRRGRPPAYKWVREGFNNKKTANYQHFEKINKF